MDMKSGLEGLHRRRQKALRMGGKALIGKHLK
jgi:hypothetical protein